MAAIIGIVARVLKTTVIWVSVVAKLNEILLVPEDNNRSKNGTEIAFLNSVLIFLIEINSLINLFFKPCSTMRLALCVFTPIILLFD